MEKFSGQTDNDTDETQTHKHKTEEISVYQDGAHALHGNNFMVYRKSDFYGNWYYEKLKWVNKGFKTKQTIYEKKYSECVVIKYWVDYESQPF